jgi:hypothetical protein
MTLQQQPQHDTCAASQCPTKHDQTEASENQREQRMEGKAQAPARSSQGRPQQEAGMAPNQAKAG